MSFKNHSFLQSVKNACNGIVDSFQSERNLKIQLAMVFLILIVGLALGFTSIEWIIIILTCTVVIGVEMVNTAIEVTIDMICHDDFHPLAKRAKDIAAGAVLITSIGALFIGSMIVLPKIIK